MFCKLEDFDVKKQDVLSQCRNDHTSFMEQTSTWAVCARTKPHPQWTGPTSSRCSHRPQTISNFFTQRLTQSRLKQPGANSWFHNVQRDWGQDCTIYPKLWSWYTRLFYSEQCWFGGWTLVRDCGCASLCFQIVSNDEELLETLPLSFTLPSHVVWQLHPQPACTSCVYLGKFLQSDLYCGWWEIPNPHGRL